MWQFVKAGPAFEAKVPERESVARGVVRAKPPLPAITGLFGKPTVINNVVTLAAVPLIVPVAALSDSPAGSAPLTTLQVYGGVPPLAPAGVRRVERARVGRVAQTVAIGVGAAAPIPLGAALLGASFHFILNCSRNQ